MGVAITGLALTPPYSMIGVAAPVLAVVFRMLQGFALGGEVGPTTALLLEAAPSGRRGFYSALQHWSQDWAILIAGLIGFTLANILTEQQLQDFGWRIAFLAGTAVVPVGLALRRSLPETFHSTDRSKHAGSTLRQHLPVAVLGATLLACLTVGSYTITYMTTYAITTLHMPANSAFAAAIAAGFGGVCVDLASGALSDRIGRKPAILIPSLLLLVIIVPAFRLIEQARSAATLFGVTAVLAGLVAAAACPAITWLSESFPAAIRSGGVSVVYAAAVALFGGTTQYTVAWLISVTGNPLAPAWYWMAAALIGLAAATAIRESAPCKTGEPGAAHAHLPEGPKRGAQGKSVS